MLNTAYSNLVEVSQKLAADYQNNTPFPNIYMDNFFEPDFLRQVLNEFPNVEQLKDRIYYSNPNENKFATKGEYSFGKYTRQLVHYLNAQPFLEFLQTLTGIKEILIPDPYFEGGGFHEIKPGGFLKLHIDFHKNRHLDLDRRLNLLIYLNEDWEESYGGHLELWNKAMTQGVTKILPAFNRVALFSTSNISWHGHPDPLTCPENRSRKSLALYYYTNGRPKHEIDKKTENRVTTTFKGRKGIDSKEMDNYNRMVNLANKVLPTPIIKFIKSKRNK